MPWWKIGNKYVDSLDDDYEEMNEAISAFRWLLQFEILLDRSSKPGSPQQGAHVASPCGADLPVWWVKNGADVGFVLKKKDSSCFIRLADLPKSRVLLAQKGRWTKYTWFPGGSFPTSARGALLGTGRSLGGFGGPVLDRGGPVLDLGGSGGQIFGSSWILRMCFLGQLSFIWCGRGVHLRWIAEIINAGSRGLPTTR